MKNLFVLFLLVHGCHLSYAQNFMPLSELKAGIAKTVYMNQTDCEKISPCVDVTGLDVATYDIANVQVDDESKPTYSAKQNIEACSDQADCQTKLQAKVCPSLKYINQDFSEVYCTQQTGFEKKEVETLVLNETKKQLQDQIKALQQVELEAMSAAKTDMDFGRSLIVLFTGKIKLKRLDKDKRKAILGQYNELINYLSMGSIDLALDEITKLTPDGEAITEVDKSLLIQKITDAGY